MLDDKLKSRLRTTARLLLYALGALYLAGLYSTIREIASDVRSMESKVDSLESDVSSMQDDVSSIQDDVSSIRDDFEGNESTPLTPRPADSKKWEARHVESLIAHIPSNAHTAGRAFQFAARFEHRTCDKKQELVGFHPTVVAAAQDHREKSRPGRMNNPSEKLSMP
jgi:outer membrane murein-binding lipoprotein Lpp